MRNWLKINSRKYIYLVKRCAFLCAVWFLLANLLHRVSQNVLTAETETETIQELRTEDLHKSSAIKRSVPEKAKTKQVQADEEDIDRKVTVKFQTQPVLNLWHSIANCSRYKVRLAARRSLPPVALVSYPGSGNTWTRFLLERASGIFTGSIYNDSNLYNAGFKGELLPADEGSTIVQKLHAFGETDVKQFNGTGIVLVRNPYRAILSYHNYMHGGHRGVAPSRDFLRSSWRPFVKKQALEWMEILRSWISEKSRTLIVHYELLRRDPIVQLRRMLRFLNWPIDEQRLKCLKASLDGEMQRHDHHRPRQIDPFPISSRHLINGFINSTSSLLRRFGHEPLPLSRYEMFNDSVPSSDLLDDCLPGESLPQCCDRVDRFNRKQNVRAVLESWRDSLRTAVFG